MDLKIEDVADLLRLSPYTIRRWLKEGKIPGYKLNREYRFSREEIEDWLLQKKMQVADENGKKNSKHDSIGSQQFSLYRALNSGNVWHANTVMNKSRLMEWSVEKIAPSFKVDPGVILDVIEERERMMPTALGQGIAVPHAREASIPTHFDLVSVVFPLEPISYGALDKLPVHTLFFLFAANDIQHLHLLAKLAHLVNAKEMREFLQTKPAKQQLLEMIKQWESSF